MKTILILLMLLAPYNIYAATTISGTGTTSVAGTGSVTVGGAPTYLIEESFDSSTEDNTWTPGHNGTNITSGCTAGAAPLDGAGSLCITSPSGTATDYVSFSNQSTVYAFAHWELTTTAAGTEGHLMLFEDSSGTNLCELKQNTSNQLIVKDEDAAYSTAGTTLVVDTEYYIWLEYSTGTGDGICRAYISTTTTKPGTADTGITNGTYSGLAGRLNIASFAAVTEHIIDDLKIDDEIIGSSP